MDWQQKVFHRLWWWVRAQVSPEAPSPSVAVRLSDVHSRLTLFARLITGEAIELLTAEQEGGWTGHFFYLPAQFDMGESPAENLSFYFFRIAYMSIQKRLGLCAALEDSLAVSRQRAYESAEQVLEALFQEYPQTAEIYACFLARLKARGISRSEAWWIWGHWMPPLAAAMATTTSRPEEASVSLAEDIDPKTLLEAPARERVEILGEVDREAIRNYTLQHYFEKVETLEAFQGTWRDTDGSDDLQEHAEALKEVDLRQVARSHDPVHSVFQSEFLPGSHAPESKDQVQEGFFLPYAEWNYQRKSYREAWCRVYPARAHSQDMGYVQGALAAHRLTLKRLHGRFSQLLNQRQLVQGQLSGDDLDLDRLLTYYTDLKSGCSPNERVYVKRRKHARDHAILLLMDLSLSSDGYTGGQRVLDIEKQAVLLFGEILQRFGDTFQVDGFSSQTRHHCDYTTFKSFQQSWVSGAACVGAAEPRGYTRIGPALRHATALLRQQKARSRWIVLLSDGKPNDYDRYEGQYGLQDVRQAIKEARQAEVQVYGLAVEAQAKHYLPMMLGHGSYRILPKATQLPEALGDFYRRLL